MKKIVGLLVVIFALAISAPASAQYDQYGNPDPHGQYQVQVVRPQQNQPQPNYHSETWQENQQKVQDQWRNSTAPGVSGVVLPPPPGMQHPGQLGQ
ncbi:MAG: hypothetical protein ABSH41_23755 [Syntrophobacteraceae bacterium]|jgi:hypothetical protein